MENEHADKVKLSVSIVYHNSSLELLRRTVQSLHAAAAQAARSGSLASIEVDILDNSSEQSARQNLAAVVTNWPQDRLFQLRYSALSANLGFGAGHNQVIAGLRSDYHLILNPDVELASNVLHIGLDELCADPSIVLLSPKVLGVTGRQEFLCKRYPSFLALSLRAVAPRFVRSLFYRRLRRYEMRDVCSGDAAAEVLLASGCFMLLRTPALQRVSGFDEAYFLYFEDFDLSLRLGSCGRLVFLPAMQIIHHGGYTAGKGWHHIRLFLRSGRRFFNQYGWRWI